jgi:hypothetical protein
MEPPRSTISSVRMAVPQMLRDLVAMYGQGGFGGVLVGTAVGIVIYHIRSRRG